MGTAEGAQKAREKRAELAALTTGTSNGNVTRLLAGVDTLNVYTTARLRDDVVRKLRQLKEESVDHRREGSASVSTWECLGLTFEVAPYGVRKGPLLLDGDALVIVLAPDAPLGRPTAYVELKARALWDEGWRSAGELAVELLGEVCERGNFEKPNPLNVQVSRIDVCCDFMGWQPQLMDLASFFGRAVRKEAQLTPHFSGRSFSGFTFGGGDLLCRLYDKSLEVKKSGKIWFQPLWREAGWIDEKKSGHVWRLEFQLRRDPLTHATVITADEETPISSWAQVAASLDALWAYLTRGWLSYRLPRAKNERVRIREEWQVLQAAKFESEKRGELFRYRNIANLNRTIGAFAGYLKRALAETWHERGCAPYKPHSVEDFQMLMARADAHYKRKHDGTELYADAEKLWHHNNALREMFGGGRRTTFPAASAAQAH